jgi:hemolysin type calcium-binding protein
MGSRLRNLAAATAASLVAAMALASAASAVPTTNVSYSNGVLFISGSFEQDLITVSVDGSSFKVTEAAPHPISTNPPCMPSGLQAVSCPQDPPDDPSPAPPKPPITVLSVSLGAGDDSLTNLTSLGTPVLESPQSGDLTLDGNDGNDVIRGGPAAETIVGGIGNDNLDGGGGDDTLLNGVQSFGCNLDCDGGFFRLARSEFDGSDNYVGGPGDDVTRFDARQDNLTIRLDGLANDGHPGENDNVQTESVVGGSGADSITGDGGPNTLVGGPGNDTLSGLRGADRLEGGRNNDSLVGGRARDQMQCDSGFDLAVSTQIDSVTRDCERTGAKLGSDTGRVRGNRSRIWIACPSAEGARCRGRVVLRHDNKKFGAGRFNVAAGRVKAFTIHLNAHGRAVMRRVRSFQVNARVRTNEPLGLAVEREKVLLTH